jgi:hypothetical protein
MEGCYNALLVDTVQSVLCFNTVGTEKKFYFLYVVTFEALF